MAAYAEESRLLREVLGLERSPVGVKFLAAETGKSWMKDYLAEGKIHYCQALMQAGHGHKLAVNADRLNCAPAQAGFGFRSLPPKISSGENHVQAGVFGTTEAAAKVFAGMIHMESGSCEHILLAPLEVVDFTPDVVVLIAEPESAMWLVLSAIHTSGNRAHFNTAVVQAACVDASIMPYLQQEVNISLGCIGCRSSTDIKTTEMFIGIPGGQLSMVLENFKKLSNKLIYKNREKLGYKRFANTK